ncbi:hypothetical protein VKT23_013246 [Stygiomarasmius scandens]|uniref:F-box domain-containing protein n=1 Tax=Marasmiellus scandens TaxID=2682957 RepID=A0ABR1J9D4_9AGAR
MKSQCFQSTFFMMEGPASPFRALLDTNYCASPADVEEIDTFLAQPESQLHALDSEIEQLRNQLRDHLCRRNGLSSYISSHRALMAPIRRLPPEVLSEIFIQCLPTDYNPTRSLTEAPLLLTRVCQSWREICFSTPRLWSALHIYIPHVHAARFCNTLASRTKGVQSWLSHSGDTPLSLSLSAAADVTVTASAGREAKPEMVAYRNFVDSLTQFNLRWAHLELRVTTPILDAFSKARPNDFSTLDTLKLDCSLWTTPLIGRRQLEGHRLDNLLQAPNLSTLELHSHFLSPLTLPIPWHRLVVVSLNHVSDVSPTPQETLDLLSQTTVLRSCSLTIRIAAPQESVSERDALDLPHLETLCLLFILEGRDYQGSSVSGDVIDSMFSYISASKLKKLSLHVSASAALSIMPRAPFMPLLKSSCQPCKIEDLDILLPISTDAILASLGLMPSLKRLSISECPWIISQPVQDADLDFIVNDAFMRELTPSFERPVPLAPGLELLNINNCQPVSERTLVEFIKAKAPSKLNVTDNQMLKTKPLRSISVRYNREMKDDIMNEVVDLQSDDFHIYVTFHPKPYYRLDSPWAGLESTVMPWMQTDGRDGVSWSYDSMWWGGSSQ